MAKYSRTVTNTAAKKGSPARQQIKSSSQSPTVMGFTRSATSTTVNGVPTSSSSTISSSGGGGGLLGPVLIIGGVFFLWIVFRGKSGAMWNAITGNSGFDVSLNDIANAVNPYINAKPGSSNSSSSNPVTGNSSDSGTHMGIGPDGSIITINKPYSDMSDAEKDAANAYAHSIGNVT